MAAFTTFPEEALERYLQMFGKGRLDSFAPIEGGIENSNYFVTLVEDGATMDYVLTIIEGMTFAEVPFFNKVMSRLNRHGLPVAAPENTLDGMTSTIFCGKPAFFFKKLPGAHPDEIDEAHCHQLGEFMAHAHQALSDLQDARSNPYDPQWMQSTGDHVADKLEESERLLIRELIETYGRLQASELPRGLIHGDLFKDNTLFEDGSLSGVIDFYHACHDLLIQDLAIAINDWCKGSEGIDEALKQAVLAGYGSIRALTPEEKDALLPLQQVSAVRFALTRILSGDPPLKDPGEMLQLAAWLG